MVEGLKVPRFPEASPDFPVVYPIGNKDMIFITKYILKIIRKLYEETNR